MVIIIIGANDVFATQSVSSANAGISSVQDNLQNIIGAIKTSNRKIYLANQFGPDTMNSSAVAGILTGLKTNMGWANVDTDSDFHAMFMSYRQMLQTLASTNEIGYIDDIWTGVLNQHMSDFIHPDAAGYGIMADKIFNAIKPYLQEKNLIK